MRFPPAFLDELKDRVSLTELVGRRVTWDKGKSQPGRGDMWACCPFHGEKSPSFHVREREGRYKCFGCHVSGNAIDFVMELDRLTFVEAVEMLAEEAGMRLPERDPRAAAQAARRAELSDVMAAGLDFFRAGLASADGLEARAYLARRGLSDATVARFEIGYAPQGRDRLARALLARGDISADQLVACDLSKPSDRGPGFYDRFQDRIMFPIRDGRGRLVAFGGRALRDGGGPKYLNSSETDLFQKRRILYNLDKARGATAGGAPLLVVEGYMDVIALDAAGFDGAVAPLGTALTEEQLEALWRVSPEPIAAFDGDEAGLRAAHKLARLAAQRVGPSRSIAFAMLPKGVDPDDLVRRDGAGAMAERIAESTPLVELLWRSVAGDAQFDTPERRAGLEAELASIAATVADPSVRRHYQDAFRDRARALFRSQRRFDPRSGAPGRRADAPRQRRAWDPQPWEVDRPTAAAKSSRLAQSTEASAERTRAVALLAAAIARPDLLEASEEEFAALSLGDPALDTVKDALISALGDAYGREADLDHPSDTTAEPEGDDQYWGPTARSAFAEAVAARLGPDGLSELTAAVVGRALWAEGPNAASAFSEAIARVAHDAEWRRECAIAFGDEGDGPAPAAEPVDDDEADPLGRMRLMLNSEDASAASLDDPEGDEHSKRLNALVESRPWIRARKRAPN